MEWWRSKRFSSDTQASALRKLRLAESPVVGRALDPNWMTRWPSCKTFLTALREALARPRLSGKKLGSRQLQSMRNPG